MLANTPLPDNRVFEPCHQPVQHHRARGPSAIALSPPETPMARFQGPGQVLTRSLTVAGPRTVLVIDDRAPAAEFATGLQQAGFRVELTRSLPELQQRRQPDAVILRPGVDASSLQL